MMTAIRRNALGTANEFKIAQRQGKPWNICGHRRRKRRYCRGSDTPTIYVGIL